MPTHTMYAIFSIMQA